jgi:tetratricopeptide (TPR) repeat protein
MSPPLAGGDKGEGDALIIIGMVYSDLGDYPKALSYYEQSLKIKRQIGHRKGEGKAIGSIGVVYKELGDYRNNGMVVQKLLEK